MDNYFVGLLLYHHRIALVRPLLMFASLFLFRFQLGFFCFCYCSEPPLAARASTRTHCTQLAALLSPISTTRRRTLQ